jgi:PKD domain
MRRGLAIVLTLAVSLLLTTPAAQAVVVDMTQTGNATVPYNPFSQNGYVGLSLMPGTPALSTIGVPRVTGSAPCVDPALTPDFTLRMNPICWHGGSVMHANEQFSLVWDPAPHTAWAASYVAQFMRDVADGSGTYSSPYAVTPQYTDGTGRAGNVSIYGGGFDDPTDFPANGCLPSGFHYFTLGSGMVFTSTNDVCVTDAQIQGELQTEIVQDGLTGKLQPGYTPLLVVQLPPGVVACLDSEPNLQSHLCSANSDPLKVPQSNPPVKPVQFCSYHSQIAVGGRVWPYIVQPFTAEIATPPAGCDEPDVPAIPNPIPIPEVRTDAGARLVGPLARAEWGAITNPFFNGWFGFDGSEIGDNTCRPLGQHVDSATVGTSGQNPYELQHAFNNAGAIVNDPFAADCVGSVTLSPVFVVPSAANQGDVIQFDGAKTQTTLLVPAANFSWDFGDGTTATGPSQYHSYAKGGTYAVKLTVTDRGGNVATLSQTIQVLDPNGKPVTTPGGGGGAGGVKTPLNVQLQLMPQSLKTMLKKGLSLVVSSNVAANGIVTLSIPRSTALRAHIKAGHGPAVVIGRGTVSRIKAGTVSLQLKLSKSTVTKLKRLRHLTVTVRLALVASTGDRKAYVAAARY